METINNIRIPEALPAVSMAIAPESAPVAITVEGVTYTWTQKHHSAGTPLTFTAVVQGLPPELSDVEHFWDFGDGHTGYGPVVTHTFDFPQPAIVKLKVTDSIGRVTQTFQVMSLLPVQNVIAVFSGRGTLTATPLADILGIATLSGSASMSDVAAERDVLGVASLVARGTLAGLGNGIYLSPAAPLTAVGTTAVDATTIPFGASLSGSGTATIAAERDVLGASSVSGSGTLSATAV